MARLTQWDLTKDWASDQETLGCLDNKRAQTSDVQVQVSHQHENSWTGASQNASTWSTQISNHEIDFNYKNMDFVVLVHLFQRDEVKENAWALLKLEFLKAHDIEDNLKLEANVQKLFV